MGWLRIISVEGLMPHSACFFKYSGTKYLNCWMGFAPAKKYSPFGKGKVYYDDESGRVKNWVEFQIPDAKLYAASKLVEANYLSANYVVLVNDCVSFSANVARALGLNVSKTNFNPDSLVRSLAKQNQFSGKS